MRTPKWTLQKKGASENDGIVAEDHVGGDLSLALGNHPVLDPDPVVTVGEPGDVARRQDRRVAASQPFVDQHPVVHLESGIGGE